MALWVTAVHLGLLKQKLIFISHGSSLISVRLYHRPGYLLCPSFHLFSHLASSHSSGSWLLQIQSKSKAFFKAFFLIDWSPSSSLQSHAEIVSRWQTTLPLVKKKTYFRQFLKILIKSTFSLYLLKKSNKSNQKSSIIFALEKRFPWKWWMK